MVESRAWARRFEHSNLSMTVDDPGRVDSYVKIDISPTVPIIVEDNGRRGMRKVLEAVTRPAGTLSSVRGTSPADIRRTEELRADFPEVTTLTLAELTGPALLSELGRSVTRQRVQQYQRDLDGADRILIPR